MRKYDSSYEPREPREVASKPVGIVRPEPPLPVPPVIGGGGFGSNPPRAPISNPIRVQMPAAPLKMHDGGIVPEDGVYLLKKGETVVPAAANNTNEGSSGSRVGSDNIRKYPTVGALEEHAPAVTGKPYGVTPGCSVREPAEPERIRRQNARNRDIRNSRWAVYHGPISVDERSEPDKK